MQYIMYAPYGEELLNQHPFSYNERFTFTGKERDAETGYDYFGARYRESNFLNHFISVDPLANKFIYNSPYVYCEGNPIKYVDPDGNAIHIALGIVIGAAIGGTISGIAAMNNPSLSNKDVLGAIAGGAVSGAIAGGITTATGILPLGYAILCSAAAGGIGEAAGSAVSQGIANGDVDMEEMLRAGIAGAMVGSISGTASKGVSEAIKKSGIVKAIESSQLKSVKSGLGKAARHRANQIRKTITNFCSPGNDKQFQLSDVLALPTDVANQQVSAGATNSEPVIDISNDVKNLIVDN